MHYTIAKLIEVVLTPEFLSYVAGILLSLAFSYIPGLKDKFDTLSSGYKSLVMLGLLAVAVGVIFSASCLGYTNAPACTAEGAKSLIPLFIAAAIANQVTHSFTKNLKG